MQTGKGRVLELLFEDGCRQVRIGCPPGLIPAPGQYLLAGDGSDSPLPVPLFHTDFAPQGFLAAAPIPDRWNPGMELHLRGPLGRGFSLPLSARRVGLVAFEDSPARLRGLITPALKQAAAVVLVCDLMPEDLSDAVEVQPMSTLGEITAWAEYLAMDVERENLNQMRERLGKLNRFPAGAAAQVLIHAPVPCGGMADCGICAVNLKSDWKLACKDGPVFDWNEVN